MIKKNSISRYNQGFGLIMNKKLNKMIVPLMGLMLFMLVSQSLTLGSALSSSSYRQSFSVDQNAIEYERQIIGFEDGIDYEYLEANGILVDKIYESFDMVVGLVPINIRAALETAPSIKGVDDIREFTVCMDTAAEYAGAISGRQTYSVDGDRDGNPTSYSKNDVVIAVVDTGIDNSHADLDGGKVIGWYDAINGQSNPYDGHGHGTHCSSIAAGTGDANSNYMGVAPGAALVGVKVLSDSGSGTNEQVIDGMQWCLTNKDVYGIDIVSMSLGDDNGGLYDATAEAADQLVAGGLTVVIAAGNSGPSSGTIGSPGSAYNAITVGAVSDPGEGGWNIASFSSRGPLPDGRIKPDVCGPGVSITAARAGTTTSYTTMSGTSMATPFVAGSCALYYDLYYGQVSPADVKDAVEASAVDMGVVGKDNTYGSGRIDVEAFLGYSNSGDDIIDPSVSITDPKENDIVQDTITITADASDNRGVTKVEFYIDGSIIGTDTTSPYALTWDSTSVADGSRDISAKAYDEAGNTDIDEITVNVDQDYTGPILVTESLVGSVAGSEIDYFELTNVELGMMDVSVSWSGSYDIDAYICETANYNSYLARGYTTNNPETTSYEIQTAGTYYIGIRMYTSSASSTAYTATVSYYKGSSSGEDIIDPTVAISNPSSGDTVLGDVAIEASASDNVGVSYVQYRIDSGSWVQDYSAPYTWTWDSTSVSDGSHSITVQAFDAAGNFDEDSISISVSNDNSNPIPITEIFEGSVGRGETDWYIVEAQPGLMELDVSWGNSYDIDCYISTTQSTTNYLARGYTTNNPETCSYEIQTAGTYYIGIKMYSYWASSTAYSAELSYYSLGVASVIDELADEKADQITEDLTGSVAGREVDYFELTDVEPGLMQVSATWGNSYDIDVYICTSASYSNYLARGYTTSNPETCSYNIQTAGTYYIAVRMYTSYASSTSYTTTVSYYTGGTAVDTEKPTISITSPSNGATVDDTISITASASDNVGVDYLRYQVDSGSWTTDSTSPYSWSLDTTTLSDGAHTITVQAYDAAGNFGEDDISITVDNDNGDVQLIERDLTGSVAGSEVDYFELSAVEAGMMEVSVSWSGSYDIDVYICQTASYSSYLARGYTTSNPETCSYNIQTAGTYYIAVRMYTSSASSTAYTATVSYYTGGTGGDYEKPTVSITSPSNGATVEGTISITASATDNVGVVDVQCRVDSGSWTSDASAPYSWSLDTTTLSEGSHTISVQAFDAAGNSQIDSISIIVDNEVSTGGKYALLCGVSDYKAISDLSYCDEDVTDYFNYLTTVCGFEESNIIVLGDGHPSNFPKYDGLATEANTKYYLNWLAQQEGEIVYVTSGHGSGTGSGSSYICSWDCGSGESGEDGDFYDTELAAILDGAIADDIFVFIDHCYSGGIGPELMAMPNSNNVYCTTTCTEDGYGYDDSAHNNGAWTYYFLEYTLINHFGSSATTTMEAAFDYAASVYPHSGGDAPMEFDGNSGSYFTL
ncbi:hypothetical protein WKT22_02712 [Candidatus Lokiarchaeum ossiferum]